MKERPLFVAKVQLQGGFQAVAECFQRKNGFAFEI